MRYSRGRYWLHCLLTAMGYVSYFASKAGFIICAAPGLLILAPFPGARIRFFQLLTHNYLRVFTRLWLPLLGVYQVEKITGADRWTAAGPVIFVANHRGFMDSLLLLSLMPRTGAVIKSRDTRQLTYRILANYFDLVSVDRHSLQSVSAAMGKCRNILGAGRNLLVFPEGTRARTGQLQHFNRMAFQLAVQTRRPVVPVIIHSTRPFMAKVPGSYFPEGRNEYRIHFLDLEMPRPEDDARSLSDRVHQRMADELQRLDTGTCWEIRCGTPVEH
jgi:1-acyl-sn-glycerol-3-phosphate acyltransferase